MGASAESTNSSLLGNIFGNLGLSPLSFVLLLIAVVCIFTRIRTSIQTQEQSISKAEPKKPAVLPYWIPWLGHAIEFIARFQRFLADASKSTKDGVFQIILGGTVHNIIIQPSVAKQVLLQRSTTLSSLETTYWVIEKFFGNQGGIRRLDPKVLFGKVHEALFQLNREPFVSNAAATTLKYVEQRTHNLVSFSSSWVDQSVWERAANVSVEPSGTSAEASFFPLIRYFVGDLACGILMGQDFMTNNPNILQDLFTFDGSFNQFLAGFPWWFPGMAPAYQARSRLVRAMREHHEALYAEWDGRDPGSGWNDLSDVSKVVQDRAREWLNLRADPDMYSTGDVAVLWAMNVNANQIIFWFLWHIYSRPELREEILQEIAPFASLTAVASDLPVGEPPKVCLNLDGLLHSCPLLKATYYETLRLETPATSYKTVAESFEVTESVEDAALAGKSQPQTYRFEKGELTCVPHGVHCLDERYWENAREFKPRRFFVADSANDDRGEKREKLDGEKEDRDRKIKVDMGTMKVFGGGATMCKGRAFAEREILLFVAGVLVGWDVEPVGGQWKDPGRVGGSGANLPKRDVRVRMKRRRV